MFYFLGDIMITKKPSEVEKLNNPHKVDTRKLYNKPEANVIHLTLQPGEKLLRHITPVDVIFYVIEGNGTVEIGEEKKEVDADTLIESPADIVHCWYNTSKSILRILVIKTPRPTTPTKFVD